MPGGASAIQFRVQGLGFDGGSLASRAPTLLQFRMSSIPNVMNSIIKNNVAKAWGLPYSCVSWSNCSESLASGAYKIVFRI